MEYDKRINQNVVAAISTDPTTIDLYNPRALGFGELQRIVACQIRRGATLHVLSQIDEGVIEREFDFNGLDILEELTTPYVLRFAAIMDHSQGFFFETPAPAE